MKSYPKTTGSKGIHIYVPIVRGPLQKEVWTVAKRIAIELAQAHPKLITSEYRIAKRPAGRVLVDYNQNAWGRTLASVYSVRAKPEAAVSTPLTWEEVEKEISIADFTMKKGAEAGRKARRSFQAAAGQSRPHQIGIAGMKLPIPLDYPPMEAESAKAIPQGTQWQYEPKWDGFRCLAFRDGDADHADVQIRPRPWPVFSRDDGSVVELEGQAIRARW